MKRRGFTLIELLVVIAIIAILVAILYSVYAHITRTAHGTQCLSNLKQIGMAEVQYRGDNDGFYPPAAYCGRSASMQRDLSADIG